MFNGLKFIIIYYIYLCIVVLESWVEMFYLVGVIVEDFRYLKKIIKKKLGYVLFKFLLFI